MKQEVELGCGHVLTGIPSCRQLGDRETKLGFEELVSMIGPLGHVGYCWALDFNSTSYNCEQRTYQVVLLNLIA